VLPSVIWRTYSREPLSHALRSDRPRARFHPCGKVHIPSRFERPDKTAPHCLACEERVRGLPAA
jgi:ribosomal protein L34E